MVRLQQEDARLAGIGFRLAASNAYRCGVQRQLTGLVLHHLEQYPPESRSVARAAFGLGDGVGIMAVVDASPASRAGLRSGDSLLSIAGVDVRSPVSDYAPARFYAVERALALLERAPREAAIALRVERADKILTVEILPQPGCAGVIVLEASAARNAWSDGHYLVVTSALVEYLQDDGELAFVVAHEMAHAVLGHRERLDAARVPGGLLRGFGRNAARVRATEAEADRLAVDFMAKAGYRAEAALSFWDRFMSTSPTHGSAKERRERLARAIAETAAK